MGPNPTEAPDPKPAPPGPRAVVDALASGVRRAVGDLCQGEAFSAALVAFSSQARALARLDPAFAAAFRAAAEERVAALVPQAEAREKALGDERDPDHTFWLLVCGDHALRRYVAQLNAGPRPVATFMLPLGNPPAGAGEEDD